MKNGKKIALVLSGGGAKGSYQAGVLKAINDRLDLDYDVISGVSVGNLNGVMMAQGKVDELVEVWKEITNDKVYKKKPIWKVVWQYIKHKIGIDGAPYGLYSNKPLFKIIKKYIDFDDIDTPFYSGRVNLNTKGYSNSISKKNIHKEVLASTTIPIIWKPVEIEGQHWVDGGVRNVTPLSDILGHKPDLIIIIPTQAYVPNPQWINDTGMTKDIVEVASRTLGIMMNEVFKEDMKRLLEINELVGQAENKGITLNKNHKNKYKYYDNIIVNPKINMGDPLNFNNDVVMERYDHGIERGKQVAEEIERLLENE